MLDKYSDRNIGWVLLLTALALRLAYFVEYSHQVEFLYPTVDALYHHITASAIANGALTAEEPFFRAPLLQLSAGSLPLYQRKQHRLCQIRSASHRSLHAAADLLNRRRDFRQTRGSDHRDSHTAYSGSCLL